MDNHDMIEVDNHADLAAARKRLHEIADGLADLADAENEAAAGLIVDFAEFGQLLLESGGSLTIEEMVEIMSEIDNEGCGNPDCKCKDEATPQN